MYAYICIYVYPKVCRIIAMWRRAYICNYVDTYRQKDIVIEAGIHTKI